MAAPTDTAPPGGALVALRAAADALSDAVERYDCMGWFDKSYAEQSEIAEAQGVLDTLEATNAAIAALEGPTVVHLAYWSATPDDTYQAVGSTRDRAIAGVRERMRGDVAKGYVDEVDPDACWHVQPFTVDGPGLLGGA